jgi:hypothetical protein
MLIGALCPLVEFSLCSPCLPQFDRLSIGDSSPFVSRLIHESGGGKRDEGDVVHCRSICATDIVFCDEQSPKMSRFAERAQPTTSNW